jgi:hypothetical protein
MPNSIYQNVAIIRYDDPNVWVVAEYDPLVFILVIGFRKAEFADPATSSAYPAGLISVGLGTDQRSGELEGELEFSHPVVTREQEGMRHPAAFDQTPKGKLNIVITDEFGKHLSIVTLKFRLAVRSAFLIPCRSAA